MMYTIKFLYRLVLIFLFVVIFQFYSSSAYAVEPTLNTWISLGLNNYTVNNLSVDPNNNDILYAATSGNGLLKSINAGDSWIAINNGLPSNFSGFGVVIDPNNSSILYTAGGQGVWKSVDAGDNWISISNGALFPGPFSGATSISISDDSTVLYLGVYQGGLWKSEDRGNSWIKLLNPDIYAIALAPSDSNIIYVGGGANEMVIKSIDRGMTWTFAVPSQLGSCSGVGAVRGVAVDSSDPNTLYVGPQPALCATAGVYKSIDGNLNWSPLSGSPGNAGGSIVTDPVRLNTVYAATSSLPYQSIDAGVNWIDIRENLPSVTIRRLIISQSNPDILYAATSGGLYIYGLDPIDNSLAVPLLKQTSEPWQSLEYDTASLWSPSDPTISRWGCALTSAAMVFTYHGINKLQDGTTLDPGSLNDWLNSQPDGYVRTGWVNWLALSRLSKLATDVNGITEFDALEYKRKNGADIQLLTEDLENGNPDILEQPGHFIVAKGVVDDTFAINDPYYIREKLNDGYSNTFLSLGRYVPSNTDLSYIMLVADPEITLQLLDQNNNVVAESFIQQQIVDPQDPNSTNGSISILYAPQPDNGVYKVNIVGNDNGQTEILAYLYDTEGNVSMSTSNLVGNDSLVIHFDKSNSTNSTTQKIVTFESVLEDIKELQGSNLLHISFVMSITERIQNAEKHYERGQDKQALKLIDSAIKYLEQRHDQFIDSMAKEILLYDLVQLKGQIGN